MSRTADEWRLQDGENQRSELRQQAHLAVLGPLVLATDLLLLLWSEVVRNVEGLTDLLWRLALDHVGDGLAADVEERLDIKVVGGEDDFEEHLLVDLHKLLVPLLNVSGLLAGVRIVVSAGWRVTLVVLAPLKDLGQDGLVDLEIRVSICGMMLWSRSFRNLRLELGYPQ